MITTLIPTPPKPHPHATKTISPRPPNHIPTISPLEPPDHPEPPEPPENPEPPEPLEPLKNNNHVQVHSLQIKSQQRLKRPLVPLHPLRRNPRHASPRRAHGVSFLSPLAGTGRRLPLRHDHMHTRALRRRIQNKNTRPRHLPVQHPQQRQSQQERLHAQLQHSRTTLPRTRHRKEQAREKLLRQPARHTLRTRRQSREKPSRRRESLTLNTSTSHHLNHTTHNYGIRTLSVKSKQRLERLVLRTGKIQRRTYTQRPCRAHGKPQHAILQRTDHSHPRRYDLMHTRTHPTGQEGQTRQPRHLPTCIQSKRRFRRQRFQTRKPHHQLPLLMHGYRRHNLKGCNETSFLRRHPVQADQACRRQQLYRHQDLAFLTSTYLPCRHTLQSRLQT